MKSGHSFFRDSADRDEFYRQLETLSKDELIAKLRRLVESADTRTELHRQIFRRDEALRAQDDQIRHAEDLLEESRDRYAELYDLAPIMYMTLDAEGVVLEINLTGCKLLGVDCEQIVGNSALAHVAVADRQKFLDHMQRCRSGEAQIISQLHLETRLGTMVPVQLTSRPGAARVGLGAASPVFRTAVTDLTELKRVEQELRASEERLKLAQSAGGIGIWDVDLVERKMRWSDEQYRLLGLEPQSVDPSFHEWQRCLHPEDRDIASQFAELKSRAKGGWLIEYRVLRPDGQIRWLSTQGKTLQDEDGEAVRVVGITFDITEAKQIQTKLEQLNEALRERTREAEHRTNQLRTLAAQLTQTENRERRRLALLLHDHLQQLLIASRMKLGALKQQLKSPDLGKILVQTAELVDEAIHASRSLSVELSPPMLYEAGLAASLEWLGQQMEEKHGLRVTVDCSDEPEDEDIRIFLFQCVRELLFNTVKHGQTDSAQVVMKRFDDERIVISVQDQGRGFDVSQLEAGWSTGESFGLLSIRERLQLLGGQTEIRSTPGHGTEAQLIAPVRKPRPQQADVEELLAPGTIARRPASELSPPSGCIRILVADDHPIVRQGLTSLLEHEPDFKIVAQAADGETAIESACQMGVDVVLMDFSMPRMNGAEATRRIHEAKPGVAVIGMSVYEEQSIADSMRQAGAVAFFRKDEASEHLVTAIRACGRRHKP